MAFWKVNQNEQVTEDPMENEKGDKSAAAMDCYSTKEDHWVLTMDYYSRKEIHWELHYSRKVSQWKLTMDYYSTKGAHLGPQMVLLMAFYLVLISVVLMGSMMAYWMASHLVPLIMKA